MVSEPCEGETVGHLGSDRFPAVGYPWRVAGRRDLSFVRGDAWTHTVRFVDAAGDPLDVSGFTFGAQVRRRWSSALVAEFTITVEAAGDLITLRLDPPDSEVEPGGYRWDLERQQNGLPFTVLAGKLTVVGDITRV